MPAPIPYAALLRAINVGGTGKLPMIELTALCTRAGFCGVKTYIASGNVVFTSPAKEAAVKATLEKALETHMKKPVSVALRTAKELEAAIAANPFPKVEPAKLLVVFFDEPLTKAALQGAVTPAGEELAIKGRELFIHFPIGQGQSKLKLPIFKKVGTGRNLNTVVKLAEMTRALGAA
jgi:uncharacterized protein (DUF1697 family)